jgi:hypothetical protein
MSDPKDGATFEFNVKQYEEHRKTLFGRVFLTPLPSRLLRPFRPGRILPASLVGGTTKVRHLR